MPRGSFWALACALGLVVPAGCQGAGPSDQSKVETPRPQPAEIIDVKAIEAKRKWGCYAMETVVTYRGVELTNRGQAPVEVVAVEIAAHAGKRVELNPVEVPPGETVTATLIEGQSFTAPCTGNAIPSPGEVPADERPSKVLEARYVRAADEPV